VEGISLMEKNRRGWNRAERLLLGASGVLVVVSVALGIWWQFAAAPPRVQIPAPNLPSPNAFDLYKAAGNALVDEPDIRRAVESQNLPQALPPTPEERARLVAANARALAMLRQGFAHDYYEPLQHDKAVALDDYFRLTDLGYLLTAEGQIRTEHGDADGAMRSYLDGLHLGGEIAHGSLMGSLTGNQIQKNTRQSAWDVVDRLSADEARTAARRMETLRARRVPYADALEKEKWSGQLDLQAALEDPGQVAPIVAGGAGGKVIARSLSPLVFLVRPKRKIMDEYTRYMDQVIEVARQPYGARRPWPPLPSDPFFAIPVPLFLETHFSHVNNEAQNGLLTVALALQAYRRERGVYPATLAELVPGYLKRIPDDPFAGKGSLQYRRAGKKYLLYSVGPDARDDGGRAVRLRPGDSLSKQSLGDIVAGINRH
jgi:hypothetical protein